MVGLVGYHLITSLNQYIRLSNGYIKTLNCFMVGGSTKDNRQLCIHFRTDLMNDAIITLMNKNVISYKGTAALQKLRGPNRASIEGEA